MADGHVSKQQRRDDARRRAERRQARQVLAWGVGLALVGVAVTTGLALGGGDAERTLADPDGWVLPAMGSTADQQDTVALADFAGRPTVVNFFASWCAACDMELPAFVSATHQVGDRVQFVGIASQEIGDPMFMPERHGLDGLWPLARDVGPDGSALSRALGARGMPITVFYDQDGRLLQRHVGALSEDALLGLIEEFYGDLPA